MNTPREFPAAGGTYEYVHMPPPRQVWCFAWGEPVERIHSAEPLAALADAIEQWLEQEAL